MINTNKSNEKDKNLGLLTPNTSLKSNRGLCDKSERASNELVSLLCQMIEQIIGIIVQNVKNCRRSVNVTDFMPPKEE